MSVIDYILGAVIFLFALIIIAVVLLQEGRSKGISGTIAGGADTFLSRGKAKAADAIFAKWTKLIAIAFVVLIIAANVVSIYLK